MEDKYLMRSNKLLWHLDRLNNWKKGEIIPPIEIMLSLTDGCNSNCSFCYGKYIGQKSRFYRKDMKKEEIYKLIDDCKELGVKSVVLMGSGENMLHKNFYDIIRYIKNSGLDIGMATNGILIESNHMKDLLECITWIRISLCASNRELYKKIHGVDKFDIVVKNIAELVKLKEKKRYNTTIGIQMVVIKDNIDDIYNVAGLGKKLGVDYFVSKPSADTPGRDMGIDYSIYRNIKGEIDKCYSLQDNKYNIVIKEEKFILEGTHNYKCCLATPFSLSIDTNGNVAPCGHLLGYKKEEFLIGNIREKSFKDILYSDRYKEVQEKVKNLDVNKDCETNCRHYYMNVFLNELNEIPEHVNFV